MGRCRELDTTVRIPASAVQRRWRIIRFHGHFNWSSLYTDVQQHIQHRGERRARRCELSLPLTCLTRTSRDVEFRRRRWLCLRRRHVYGHYGCMVRLAAVVLRSGLLGPASCSGCSKVLSSRSGTVFSRIKRVALAVWIVPPKARKRCYAQPPLSDLVASYSSGMGAGDAALDNALPFTGQFCSSLPGSSSGQPRGQIVRER